jgi:serine/threonine protein kinase
MPACVWAHPRGGAPVFGTQARRFARATPPPISGIRHFLGQEMSFPLGAESKRPEEVAGLILYELKRRVQDAPEVRSIADTLVVDRAVIAVPHSVSRDEVATAARLAGVEVIDVVGDGEAAVRAYCRQEGIREGLFAVCDLGATFKTEVIRCADGAFEQIAAAVSTNHLDIAIAAFVGPTGTTDTDLVIEEIKEQLSANTNPLRAARLHRVIHREEVERAIGPEVESAVESALGTIRSAVHDLSQLNCVIVTGNSSRLSVIGRFLGEALSGVKVAHLDPDIAVAEGAAFFALEKGGIAYYNDACTVRVSFPGRLNLGMEISGHIEALTDPADLSEARVGTTSEPSALHAKGGAFTLRRPAGIGVGDADLLIVSPLGTEFRVPLPPPVTSATEFDRVEFFANQPGRAFAAAAAGWSSDDFRGFHMGSPPPGDGGLGCIGPYELVRELGRSDFAVTFLARDTQNVVDRQIALKLLLAQASDPQWAHLVRRAAGVVQSSFNHFHPNVLKFEVKHVDGKTFFISDYLDGGNLEQRLQDLLPEDRTRRVINALEPLCEGLAFVHRRLDLVHGDLKPANILVSADFRELKLADCGLTELLRNAAGWETAGNARFCSPESLIGERSPLADIYALGATIYTLLTGNPPFDEALSPQDAIEQRNSVPDVMARCGVGVPPWVLELLMRCMAPSPADRFQNVDDVLAFVIKHVDPRRERSVILTAYRNPEDQTVDYDLELAGRRCDERLTNNLEKQLIEDLCKHHRKLGEMALDGATDRTYILDELKSIGEDGGDFVLGRRVRTLIADHEDKALTVRYDPRLDLVPWELLHAGSRPLCRSFAMSRQPRLCGPVPRHGDVCPGSVRVLIMFDTCNDLPGARDEGHKLMREIKERAPRWEVVPMDASSDTFSMRAEMRRCHILHFAGHAKFADNGGDLRGCGWRLAWNHLFPATDIKAFWRSRPPVVIFANACWSGAPGKKARRQHAFDDAEMGMAQAFLAAGVGCYIGALWKVPDSYQDGAGEVKPTIHLAERFYERIAGGASVGRAVLEARNECASRFGEHDLTWARYVLYGDPLIHIPLDEAQL